MGIFNFFICVVAKLQEDQQRRIMPKFDDDENIRLDKQIRINTYEMTRKIKECEDLIKEISMHKIDNPQEAKSNLYFQL